MGGRKSATIKEIKTALLNYLKLILKQKHMRNVTRIEKSLTQLYYTVEELLLRQQNT